ncbi:putative P-loop containing nucleoside triphosphate hydrolase [Helianthus annuus]|nr:putative P-loop containing nucleoside triphosphate hydrolase [Helianthus annuus]
MKGLSKFFCRRTKNNPILLGQAGVGKTAIAKGLASRISDANVPVFLLVGGNVILFIDEVHTLIGSGTVGRGNQGSGLQQLMIKSMLILCLYLIITPNSSWVFFIINNCCFTFRPTIVGAGEIAEVASLWSAIPIQQLTVYERMLLVGLDERLKERVCGQDEAVDASVC